MRSPDVILHIHATSVVPDAWPDCLKSTHCSICYEDTSLHDMSPKEFEAVTDVVDGCFRPAGLIEFSILELNRAVAKRTHPLEILDSKGPHLATLGEVVLNCFDLQPEVRNRLNLVRDYAPRKILFIERLFVEPKHRGKGYGQNGLALLLNYLGYDCDLAFLTMQPYDTKAIAAGETKVRALKLDKLYQGQGFRPIKGPHYGRILPGADT